MKRGLVLGLVSVFLVSIGFASAFSFSETLSFLDPSLITLAVLFVVIFAVLYFSTSKLFKGQTKIAAVISIALSFLAVYWINSAANIGGLFAGFGISDENLYTIGSILFIALAIFLFVKLKFGVFLIIGGIFILAGATGLVYSTDIAIIIGIVLVVIGIFGWFKKKGKVTFSGPRQNWISRGQASQNIAQEEQEIRGRTRRREKAREEEVANLQNKAKADQNIARANENARQQQQQRMIGQERREVKQIEQKETSLISTDIHSLMNSYRALEQTYNEIYRQDPSNPRLRDLMTDMVRIRDEMIRIKREQR